MEVEIERLQLEIKGWRWRRLRGCSLRLRRSK